jgi:hypothetical protein
LCKKKKYRSRNRGDVRVTGAEESRFADHRTQGFRMQMTTPATASAAMAPNKFLAKLASDWRKPDGLFVIRPDEVEAFLLPLPVGRLAGVGKVTGEKLAKLGPQTVADLRKIDLSCSNTSSVAMVCGYTNSLAASTTVQSCRIGLRNRCPRRILSSLTFLWRKPSK